MRMNRLRRYLPLLFCALGLAVLLAPDLAFAQGAGQLTSLTTWSLTSIISPLLSIGVLLIGAGMLFMQWNLKIIGIVALGGLIAANYSTLAGFFGV